MKKHATQTFKQLLVFSVLMLMGTLTYGQGRSYIRDKIQERGCRNVAITKSNGDLMLYGLNGCARSGCPKSLDDAIVELNNNNVYIDDIQLTEKGDWLILYGDNGFRWSNIPSSLETKMRQYNSDKEVVTSVTFNDSGDWVIITTEHFSSSSSEAQEWLKQGLDDYGALWAVCLTDDAMVAVYEKGYKFLGEVPQSLKDALHESNIDVYRLKIAGTSWFFADKKGHYQYSM